MYRPLWYGEIVSHKGTNGDVGRDFAAETWDSGWMSRRHEVVLSRIDCRIALSGDTV